jgi:FXSXX-COOH protein
MLSNREAGSAATAARTECEGGPQVPAWQGGLPDLTGMDLESLRTLGHPVLSEMMGELMARLLDPERVFAAFTRSVP